MKEYPTEGRGAARINVRTGPRFSRERFLKASERTPSTLRAISAFARNSVVAVLGDSFDAGSLEQITQITLEQGTPVTPQRAPFVVGMLRASRALAEQMDIDGSHPAMRYLLTRASLLAEREARTRTARSEVRRGGLTEQDIEDLGIINARRRTVDNDQRLRDEARRREILAGAIQPSAQPAQAEQQERVRTDRLARYAALHKLDDMIPLLDELAQVTLSDPSVQEDRIGAVFSAVPTGKERSSSRTTTLTRRTQTPTVRLSPPIAKGIAHAEKLSAGTTITGAQLAQDAGIGKVSAYGALHILANRGRARIVTGYGTTILGKGVERPDIGPQMRVAINHVISRDPGTLISAPELAAATHVSKVTAAHALRSLAAEGLVDTHRGGRTLILGEGIEPLPHDGPQVRKAMDHARSLPAGTRTTAKELAALAGVGVTSAAFALNNLKTQGEVVSNRRAGTIVKGQKPPVKGWSV